MIDPNNNFKASRFGFKKTTVLSGTCPCCNKEFKFQTNEEYPSFECSCGNLIYYANTNVVNCDLDKIKDKKLKKELKKEEGERIQERMDWACRE